MGTITRGLSNNITTGGVILPAGITNSSVSAVTSFANASGGVLVLLSTQTANDSATISFTSELNSTYDSYEFHFTDIHPRTNAVSFLFNISTDSGSNYNVTKTTNAFNTQNSESGGDEGFGYQSAQDLAQSTDFQRLTDTIGNGADESGAGTLQLFNPSSNTFVKHYISNFNYYHEANYTFTFHGAGYGNTTSAVNAIQFKMSSGNFDGVIKMYGLKKS